MDSIDLTQGGFRPPLPTGLVAKVGPDKFIPVGNPAEDTAPMFPGVKPFVPPKPTDLSDLSPERRKNVLAAMKQLSEQLSEKFSQGADVESEVTATGGFVDLSDPKPEAKKESYSNRTTEAAPPAPETTPQHDSGAHIGKTHCQHCGWNLSREDPEDPTDDEKARFVEAVAFGNTFTKTYDLFNGQVKITFRFLTTEEIDTCYTQAAYDVQRGLVKDVDNYFRTFQDYVLCLSIARYVSGGKAISLPGLDGYKVGELPEGCTKLKKIVPHIYDKVLVTNSARKAASAACARFNRLVEKLEARADDPDFYRATAGRR